MKNSPEEYQPIEEKYSEVLRAQEKAHPKEVSLEDIETLGKAPSKSGEPKVNLPSEQPEREVNSEAKRKKEAYVQGRLRSKIKFDVYEFEKQKHPNNKAEIEKLLPKGSIGELYWPMKTLVKDLALQLEEGRFDLLIGEDASGRVPAYILRQVVNKIYELTGRPHPKMIYLAGASNLPNFEAEKQKMDAIVTHLKDVGIEQANLHKALIITDTIHTGRSYELLSWALERLNISSDIASVATTKREDQSYMNRRDDRRHVGWFSSEPQILHKSSLSGVKKDSWDVHAKSMRDGQGGKHDEIVNEYVNKARQDAGVVADMLVQWYSEVRPVILEDIKEVRYDADEREKRGFYNK